MPERTIAVGLASFIRADSPDDTVVWGFGLMGQVVDVHPHDLERFDRLNAPSLAPVVPLPPEPYADEDDAAPFEEPARPTRRRKS